MSGWMRRVTSVTVMTAMIGLVPVGLAGCGTTEPVAGDEPVTTETASTDENATDEVTGQSELNENVDASEVDGDGIWVPTKMTVTSDEKSGGTSYAVSFAYDENGNCTSVTSGDGEVATWEKRYDENGYVSGETCSYDDALISAGSFSVTANNEFDENGKLVRMTQEGATEEDDIWVAYEYDSEGDLTKVRNSDGYEYSYNEHGNVISVSYENPYVKDSGNFTAKYEYAYDENGVASGATETITNQRDENGDSMPDETNKISYERDENGNITKKTLTLSDGATVTTDFEYEHIDSPSTGARLYSHANADFHRIYAE